MPSTDPAEMPPESLLPYPWIQPADVLAELWRFYKQQAATFPPHDLAARKTWFQEVHLLLRVVPNTKQRVWWATQLAGAIRIPDVPLPEVIGWLLHPKEVRR